MNSKDLKEKLLKEYKDKLSDDFSYISDDGIFSFDMDKIEAFLSSALSQVIEATQEIKKGETKRIAYQQGYREAREEIHQWAKDNNKCSDLISTYELMDTLEALKKPLTCSIHSRILIGKDKCVDCESLKKDS